jgi:hypothetical protein
MKEATGSSETSVLTRATRRNNPEDTFLYSHRRENLKSYKKNVVFWDVTPCVSCKHRRFGRIYRIHHHGAKNQRPRNKDNNNWLLLVISNVAPNSLIHFTFMMEALHFSETPVVTRAARRHDHCRENLKSYNIYRTSS